MEKIIYFCLSSWYSRDISLEKVDREKDGLPKQQNHEIQVLLFYIIECLIAFWKAHDYIFYNKKWKRFWNFTQCILTY